MNFNLIYEYILVPWIILGLIAFIILMYTTAPYGKFSKKNWGPMISSKNGWIIQESVSPIIFAYFFISGDVIKGPTMWIFFAIWVGHYFNRSFIYPFRQTKSSDMPIIIMLSAVFFNIINGFINGYYLGSLSNSTYIGNYFLNINFILGLFVFLAGLIINLKSDNILLKLKKEHQGYQIPKEFLYKYISCPNYLGEMLEWIGFAIMTWSLPGLIFALWTIFNLLPRAKSNHEWYNNHFPNYPLNRKIIIPFIY